MCMKNLSEEEKKLLADLDRIIESAGSGEQARKEVVQEDYLEGLMKKMELLFTVNKIYRQQDLNSNGLARSLGTNTYYLSILVNSYVKCTLRDYINRFRVNEAQQLLRNDSSHKLTLEAIGELVGFNSKSSFYRVFKSMTGMSPNVYKQTLQR